MTRAFMLDTDTVSHAMRGLSNVAGRLVQYGRARVCISSLTLAELRFGASRRKSKRIHALIDAFTSDVDVLAFDAAAAGRFGVVATALADAGNPIGLMDTLIAAHALDQNLTLVTQNTKHFGRVPGLNVVNWE
ncbi:MAG: PIN domain-containing protein [Candidatus Riflebacteria bacterium]|nr:PIN domain-containing protein [Candidatus Riflebacteria bacterium]